MQDEDLNAAKQFNSFKALSGFEEAVKLVEDNINGNISIDTKIKKLKLNDYVTIKYYYGFDFVETSGNILNIDFKKRKINVLNSEIMFEDIIDIC